ncbi:MAG: YegS/Rv2252/BmrU family lipid kinase [Paludibacteraceae bacterium]|nr:YegS/Rv2252/BmrU family lipid kinase [Paludibacteraceae bacterium]
MERILFVINPIAGGGNGAKKVGRIRRLLDKNRFSPDFAFTEHGGHATEIASRAAADGVDVVVAVGGDGTVNETACGLIGTRTALGIIPNGSGDGLALHLGIPRHLPGAMRKLNHGNSILADSGIVEGHRFFCTTGVGFDAKVACDYAKAGSRGIKTYIAKAVEDWKNFKPSHYVITTEDTKIEVDAMLVTVGNANQWGNRCHIAPTASVTDGLLEITIVKPISIVQAPDLLIKLFKYEAYKSEHIIHLRGKKITIQRDGGLEAHYDGEAIMLPETIHIECCMQTIHLWC